MNTPTPTPAISPYLPNLATITFLRQPRMYATGNSVSMTQLLMTQLLELENFDFHRARAIVQNPFDVQRQAGGYFGRIDGIQQDELIAACFENSLPVDFVNLAADVDLKLYNSNFQRLQNFTNRVWIEFSARLVSQHDRFLAEADLHLVHSRHTVEVDFRKPRANSAGNSGCSHGHLLHLACNLGGEYKGQPQTGEDGVRRTRQSSLLYQTVTYRGAMVD